ncbi:YhbY family RNA-binding protein [Methanosalsum natronophilum]|uniref:YhbY family RNA-binding protein n=1 Tax=Methanosalsum natronophilum TaxID=768733 RepID=A0A424YY06_9EURY|nr:YhbY family RNA-binding protein [Methanosalsum natronophilum]MCS3923523.1 RNA-binding protein [Methanosalsum natronophilum]RQD85422.1 MAG: YhbY family RNA-binding protein [Methanosalsum natronophilum]
MDKKKLYELKSKSNQLKPSLNIGKKGLDEQVIEELKKTIKKDRLVKVKVLKTALEDKDIETISNEITEKTSSTLIEIRGYSVTIYR